MNAGTDSHWAAVLCTVSICGSETFIVHLAQSYGDYYYRISITIPTLAML